MSNTLHRTYKRIRNALTDRERILFDAFPFGTDPIRFAGKGGLRQASEDLNAAADLIAEGRWVRGTWVAPANYLGDDTLGTCFCAEGAILEVTGSMQKTEPTSPRAAIALAMADAVTRRNSIQNYNDETGRTPKQVERKLREAATRAADLADALPRNGSKALETVVL